MNKNKAHKPATSPSGDLTEGEGADRADREHAETLVRRAQNGDLDAFEALYRMYVDRVYAICYRLTTSQSRTEQLTQDVFVLAWEKLSTFRREAAFTTWLHRLAVNAVLQDQRARRRRRQREQVTEDISLLAGATPAPALESRIDLERAIAGLPERARTVFVLHDIEGYRHNEIAKMMNTSIGTSKAQLHRARTLLRKALVS